MQQHVLKLARDSLEQQWGQGLSGPLALKGQALELGKYVLQVLVLLFFDWYSLF